MTPPCAADIANSVADVRRRMDAAALRTGRDPASVRLLPVTKTIPVERLRLAFAAGVARFGENKVQEAREKSEALADLPVTWSVIGHLQTNKAKYVARLADEFQALDSVRVAAALDAALQKQGRALDVFIQVNTSGEASKFGLQPEQMMPFLRELPAFQSLHARGLMTLAVFSADAARVRRCFRLLHELRARHRDGLASGGLDELSMGMSGDYEIAIEEGATIVRVGQAIFGPRSTPDSIYWPEGSPDQLMGAQHDKVGPTTGLPPQALQ